MDFIEWTITLKDRLMISNIFVLMYTIHASCGIFIYFVHFGLLSLWFSVWSLQTRVAPHVSAWTSMWRMKHLNWRIESKNPRVVNSVWLLHQMTDTQMSGSERRWDTEEIHIETHKHWHTFSPAPLWSDIQHDNNKVQ